jgi:hypothetical protein
MVSLGFTRKQLYGSSESRPTTEKSLDREKVYPEIVVDGKLAEAMGAPDLDEGDVVEVPVVLRVKRHSETTTNGETTYGMTLCIEKMGDMVESDDGDEADEPAKDNSGDYETSDDGVSNLRIVLGAD